MRAITYLVVLSLLFTIGCDDADGDTTTTSGAGGWISFDTVASASGTAGAGGSEVEEPIPCETQADCVGHYPYQICFEEQCSMKPWSKNCIGATGPGTTDTGCDDQNPCTTDVVVGGECFHEIAGTGTSCGENMQCWAGSVECCPVESVCGAEGVQAECADGSVCFSGQCWISCKENPDSCTGTQFPTCVTRTVGSVSVDVCE